MTVTAVRKDPEALTMTNRRGVRRFARTLVGPADLPGDVHPPSAHGGFLGGEYGQMGEPDAFAAALCEVIAQA